ncbi:MAG: aspartate/glutamate racemase family protein [Filifactoraceae bacterium]
MEKILGVIGGMGPVATIQFYNNITKKTPARKDQEHIRMIILNHSTMPDRTSAILSGKVEEVYNELLKDAKYLEAGGAVAIAIPCNTSHYFVPSLEREVKIPFINMIKEAAKQAKTIFGTGRIGILATDGTIQSKLYQEALKEQGLEPFVPSVDAQKLVMNIIYRDIKAGFKGSVEDFRKVENQLQSEGCQGAILACTELSIFKEQENLGSFYIDAMSVLEDKAIELMRG